MHLVRAANGIDSLREFAAALRAHPPGVEHELVFAMKGFASRAEAAPYIAEVADLTPTIELFPDVGLDLGSVLRRPRRGCVATATASSTPTPARWSRAGWPSWMRRSRRPTSGIVGATGAWLSSHSWLTYSMGLPSFYRSVLPPIREARRLLLEIDLEQLRIERRSRGSTRLRYADASALAVARGTAGLRSPSPTRICATPC